MELKLWFPYKIKSLCITQTFYLFCYPTSLHPSKAYLIWSVILQRLSKVPLALSIGTISAQQRPFPGWRFLNNVTSWPRNCKNSIQWDITDDFHKWKFCSRVYGFPMARMKLCWSYWCAKAPTTSRASYQHGCYFPYFDNVNSVGTVCVSWVFLCYCSDKPAISALNTSEGSVGKQNPVSSLIL